MNKFNDKIVKEIAKIWAEVKFGQEEKGVTSRTGLERVIWFVLPKVNKFDEWIFAKHYFQGGEMKPKDIAKDLFFGSLKNAIKNSCRLSQLKESFWARLKFLFILE